MGRKINLNESLFRSVIRESVIRILNEMGYDVDNSPKDWQVDIYTDHPFRDVVRCPYVYLDRVIRNKYPDLKHWSIGGASRPQQKEVTAPRQERTRQREIVPQQPISPEDEFERQERTRRYFGRRRGGF